MGEAAAGRWWHDAQSATARQPLSKESERRIFSQYQNGEPIEALAKRYHRTPACIAQAVKRLRAERIMELPLDFVPNTQFSRILRGKTEANVLGPPPAGEAAPLARAHQGHPRLPGEPL